MQVSQMLFLKRRLRSKMMASNIFPELLFAKKKFRNFFLHKEPKKKSVDKHLILSVTLSSLSEKIFHFEFAYEITFYFFLVLLHIVPSSFNSISA